MKPQSKTLFGIPVIADAAMPPGTGLLGPSANEVLRLMAEENLTLEEIARRYFCVIKMHAQP